MQFAKYRIAFLALCAVFALRARELSAQAQIISLAATAPSTLAVTITSGAVQTIAGITDNAVNSFPAPVVIQTDWNVNPGQTNTINLVAYFTTPAQALVGGATQIPSSRVEGRMLTGIPVAFTAITQNGIGGVGTAGGSLRLFAVNISGANKDASRTDNLDLQLNLVGFPTLGAGAYAGVLNLRAVTQ
jgi:spore coat protein U-like protein